MRMWRHVKIVNGKSDATFKHKARRAIKSVISEMTQHHAVNWVNGFDRGRELISEPIRNWRAVGSFWIVLMDQHKGRHVRVEFTHNTTANSFFQQKT